MTRGKPLSMIFTPRFLSRCFRGLLIPASFGTAIAQIPAFPGAEGFGAHATGGRGGDVYYVTNLNSSGAGSLAEGIASAPSSGRTIVFGVSGHIPVSGGTLRIVQNKVTIAGQTAPGDGVGIKGGRLLVTGDDAVVRNFRVRIGASGGGDCVNVEPSAVNTILDHVSMQFSLDEIISLYYSQPVDKFTLQGSIASNSLESHSKGGLWDVLNASCIDTLWAHHTDRNPKAQPKSMLEWVNNVTLDYGAGFLMGDTANNYNFKANVIGCYFVHSRYGDSSLALESARATSAGLPNFSLWLDNCLHDSNIENYPSSQSGVLNGTNKGYSIAEGEAYNPNKTYNYGDYVYAKATAPHAGALGNIAVTPDGPLVGLKKVVSDSGAIRLNAAHLGAIRDEVDALAVDDLLNQRRRQINSEANLPVSNGGFGTLASKPAPTDADKDGMPDQWEAALGYSPTVANNNAVFANNGTIITASTFFPPNTPAGYTQLEEYLHFLMQPHAFVAENTAAAPSVLTVDLRRYTSGFSNSPAFTVSGVNGGAIQQFAANGTTASSNGPIVKFTPTQDTRGRAGFSFSVTDAEGSTWSRQFPILVTYGSASTAPPSPIQINVDCGSGTNYAGTAAAPLAGTVWNNVAGQSTSTYTITNALGAYGAATPCDVSISSSGTTIKAYNEATAANGNPTPLNLMSDYLYGNTYTVTVSDLPAGNYQLYVYGHGDQAAQGSVVTINAANGGGSATAGTTGTQYRNVSTAGAEGYSYLNFQPVVGESGTLVFTVASYLNGFQLLAEPKQNLFVNMTTANGNTGANHSIPAMSGWGYSAAAPVVGERWNVFNETNYNSTFPNPLNPGQVWNIVSNVSLLSADGTTSGAKMSVAYHAVTDTLTDDRLSMRTGVATNQGGGVMEQLLRNYWDRAGSGNFQRFSISGLTANKPYLLYIYGASDGNAASYTAKVDLDRNGTVDIATTDPSTAANSDALFTYDGSGGYSLTPVGQVWNKGVVTTDASGVAAFDSRTHLNGFQLVNYQPPQITSHPAGQAIHVGEQASFTVAATADPSPSYQWRKDGTPIPGANESSYTIPTSAEADAGSYSVVVSNAGSSVTSDAAALEFIDPYGAYISSFSLDPETNGAPDANPDSDGLANALEFFLGTNPTRSDPAEDHPSARAVEGGIEYVFHRFKDAADTAFVVEYSSDLSGGWNQALNGVDEVTILTEPLDATHEKITVTIPTAEQRIFVRLRL